MAATIGASDLSFRSQVAREAFGFLRMVMAFESSISSFNFSLTTTTTNANASPSILCSTLYFSTRKHLLISANSIKLERKGKHWHKRAYVSLFGVGAADALAMSKLVINCQLHY